MIGPLANRLCPNGLIFLDRVIWACLAILIVACPLFAQDTDSREIKYNRDIRPILAEHCFACHGTDSVARKADLRLDQRDAAIDSGAISASDPDDSELIARIESDDEDLVMPPPSTKKTMTDEQKKLLRLWIESGAEYEAHWAFIKPEKKTPPTADENNWAKNDIDRFVLEKLNTHGLEPSPEASPNQIIRRLSFDITGLPPTAGQVDDFVADYNSDPDRAVNKWIDRMMESTAWGEHRARYWLDAARYGDTHGLHFDNYREMWPYRDWVIRAFNRNQPYDQFTVEQLAGDLLESPTTDQLVATGFQRCAISTNEGGTIKEENLATYAADRVQTFGWVYLGLTTNCCQCHDHKFDPISMKDYYSLAAYFRNTTQPALDGNVKDGRGPTVRVPTEMDLPRWKALPGEIAAAKKSVTSHVTAAHDDLKKWAAELDAEALKTSMPGEGLVAHIPLNDGEGEKVKSAIADQGPYSVTNKPAWKAAGGLIGPALQFKQPVSVDVGAVGDFEHDQPFSVSAWVKTTQPNQNASILARMDEGAKHRGWDMWTEDSRLAMHIVHQWPGNALKVHTTTKTLKANQWQHVCLTWDGSGKPEGIRLYVDGKHEPHRVTQKSYKEKSTVKTETPLRIGRRSSGAGYNGQIQSVRIFNRKLEDKEFTAIRNGDLLLSVLDTEAEKRTDQQKQRLNNYLLTENDPTYIDLQKNASALEQERREIESRSPITHIQKEKDAPAKAHILMRGQYDAIGEEVTAAPPASLHPLPADAPANRLGLARWVVDRANPLTSRVTVNRFWQEAFGQGLVVTPDDFGVMGALPSHPELLDWLAVDFQENGWDVKRLFKQILSSATYRQACVFTPDNLQRDRDNRLFSRGPRFRMDAEMIRDNALSVSGLLSEKMYGPGVKPYQPTKIWDMVGLPSGDTRKYSQSTGEDLYRRTLYNFWKRMAHSPNMETLNAPSREVCTVRRERTNTPLAALVTLNDPQFVEAARKLAELTLKQDLADDSARINFIAKRLISREFNSDELQIALSSHQKLAQHYGASSDDAKALIATGESKPDSEIAAAELAAWTATCNQLMNLDEVLNK